MKRNMFLSVLLIIAACAIQGCAVQNTDTEPFVDKVFENKVVYKQTGDVPLDDLKIDCDARGGQFNECGSPCETNEEVCIKMCAFTCELAPSNMDEESETNDDVSDDVSDANIVVTDPSEGDTIQGSLALSGRARVYENNVEYRLSDANGNILVEGFVTADSPDVGEFGDFEVLKTFDTPATETGKLEVFSSSARDGSEINKVTIDVNF